MQSWARHEIPQSWIGHRFRFLGPLGFRLIKANNFTHLPSTDHWEVLGGFSARFSLGKKLNHQMALGWFKNCVSSVYIWWYVLYSTIILHLFLVIDKTCVSAFVVFTHFASSSSLRLLPWVFALLVSLIPVMYLLEGPLRLSNAGNGEDERFVQSLTLGRDWISLLGLYASIFTLKFLK